MSVNGLYGDVDVAASVIVQPVAGTESHIVTARRFAATTKQLRLSVAADIERTSYKKYRQTVTREFKGGSLHKAEFT